MRSILLPLAFAAQCLQAQPIVTNGYFTDGIGNFSFADWYSFCAGSAPTFLCSSNAIGIAPNSGPSPCPFASNPTGIHTKLVGVEIGVPYELTFCSNVDVMDGGDVGIFANTAGQMPGTYYGSGGIVDVWSVNGPGPVNNIINFTVPASYAGQDLWLFVEYSFAPDNSATLKEYTGFEVVENTGMGLSDAMADMPAPLFVADGRLSLRPQWNDRIASVQVISASGTLQLDARNWNGTSLAGWAPGVYCGRVEWKNGRVSWQKFVVV